VRAPETDVVRADLDRSNISNAYVSGMREELNMVGTDFNVSSLHSSDEEVTVQSLTRFTENQHHLHLWLYHWHGTQLSPVEISRLDCKLNTDRQTI
jgi:hypothetical protein